MPEVIEAKRQALANIQQQLVETETPQLNNLTTKDTIKGDQPATPVNGASPAIKFESNNTPMATGDIKIEASTNGNGQQQPQQKNGQDEETAANSTMQNLNKNDETNTNSNSGTATNGATNNLSVGKDATKAQNTQNFKNHNAQQNANELNGKLSYIF